MSSGPINSARSCNTSGRQGHHDAIDFACDVTPVLDVGHTQPISPQGSIHAAASSHNEKQKGRAREGRKSEHLGNELRTLHDQPKSVEAVKPTHQELYKETHIVRKGVPQGQEAPWCGDKPKARHDTYVSECSATYGLDSASWLPRDNDAWATAVEGCHNNFMLGIGSQLNPEELGFTYRKQQPKGNSYVSLMILDLVEKQAKDREAMQKMRDDIGQVKEQREAMQRMLEDMGRLQASLSQQFAAFSAYRMRPPSATLSLSHIGQAFPLIGTSFPTTGPSFHASGPSFPHAMPMQIPIEPAFPMG
ncbi:hypothetical protein SLEP1_g24445 [Rubroshorea leprosula]|uniref:Uncharacterized protein n=1 Tax=Rubroshorea leprosula TaxID=152421 RepID=A0AAV5JRU7_9ROSI|nr:hypothetical protein SLEP1_g24445 [Rubroshorea leprosula]